MSIHCVFISSTKSDGATIDRALRQRFPDVYRVGTELWLVDTGHGADGIAEAMRPVISGRDKLFVAAMTRDFVPILSSAARLWLTAPERSWRERNVGRGLGEAEGSPFAIAA